MLTNPHVESTAAIWPNNQQLKDKLSFPLALALQPFANAHPDGKASADRISQYRCQSCKAFLNQLCFIRSDRNEEIMQMSTTARCVAAPTTCARPSISPCPNSIASPTASKRPKST